MEFDCVGSWSLLFIFFRSLTFNSLTSKINASSKTLHNLLNEHPTCAKVWSVLIFSSHLIAYWKFGSVFKFFQNGVGPTILKDALCAHGTNGYATKFRKSLWMLFCKQEIIKFRKETKMESVKKKIMIMMQGVFPDRNTFRFTATAFRKLLSIYVFSYFPFGFEGRMWDLIVSVPDHCLYFYLTTLITSPTDFLLYFQNCSRY